MDFSELFSQYGLFTLSLLALTSFTAGFIDAVVGGGGLIQLPFLLINFSTIPVPMILGTNKIASLSGTSVAAVRYSQLIKFDVKLLVAISACCAATSFAGAQVINHLNPAILKPLILVILIAVAIYTFIKKNLGHAHTKNLNTHKQLLFGSLIGIIVGFYDGFFGPGTGSFFVLGFVVILGFEFVHASAYAKVVNCVTNIGALIVFIKDGNYIFSLAVLLAIFNMTGNYLGSHIALKRGNAFVRVVFLLIVSMLILKFGYDVLSEYRKVN